MYIFDLSTQLLKYKPNGGSVYAHLPPHDGNVANSQLLGFKRDPIFLSDHGVIRGAISSVVLKRHIPPAAMPDVATSHYVITYLPLNPECLEEGCYEIAWDGNAGFMREIVLTYTVNTDVMDVLTSMILDQFYVVPNITDSKGTTVSLTTVYGNDHSKYLVLYNGRPAIFSNPILVGEYAKYVTLLLLDACTVVQGYRTYTVEFDPLYLEYPTPKLYPVKGIVTLTDYEQNAFSEAFTF